MWIQIGDKRYINLNNCADIEFKENGETKEYRAEILLTCRANINLVMCREPYLTPLKAALERMHNVTVCPGMMISYDPTQCCIPEELQISISN